MPRKGYGKDENYHLESSDAGMSEEEYLRWQAVAAEAICSFTGYNYDYIERDDSSHEDYLSSKMEEIEDSYASIKRKFKVEEASDAACTRSHTLCLGRRDLSANLGFDLRLCPHREGATSIEAEEVGTETAPLLYVLARELPSTVADILVVCKEGTDRTLAFGLSRRCGDRSSKVGGRLGCAAVCCAVDDSAMPETTATTVAGPLCRHEARFEEGRRRWLQARTQPSSAEGKRVDAILGDCAEHPSYRFAMRSLLHRQKRLVFAATEDDKAYREYVVRSSGGARNFRNTNNSSEALMSDKHKNTIYRNYTPSATNPYLLSRAEWFAQHRKPELLRAIHSDLAAEKAKRAADMAGDRAYEDAMWGSAMPRWGRGAAGVRNGGSGTPAHTRTVSTSRPEEVEGSVDRVAARPREGRRMCIRRCPDAVVPTANRFGALAKRK